MDARVKILEPHSADCYLADEGREEFVVRVGHLYRARDGSFRGKTCSWEVFACNCAHCHATVMVRFDAIMDMIAKGLAT